MTTGETKLKQDMEEAGWGGVLILPPGARQRSPAEPAGIEALGREPSGRYTIWADAGRDGHMEGYELVRGEEPGSPAASSGRVRWSRGVPTPEQAVGAWEERRVADIEGGRP